MPQTEMIDHLFRHQYGKMVSILTRAFGLSNLEIIEDAVQDTFLKAINAWKMNPPENPEGWLITAARNRLIDIFRKVKNDHNRELKITGPSSIAINEIFLEDEVEDSQLRMIFTACHPILKSEEQIAFSLKTISGFNEREIASALLLKQETIKKRLQRARKKIREEDIQFEIPQGTELSQRMANVLHTLYLIFNEGFHSAGKTELVRKDLCGEAMRLADLLQKAEYGNLSDTYALSALMCFHAARLDSKIDPEGGLITLRNQNRKTWDKKLVVLGNIHMMKAVETEQFSNYHYEAAIAAEHIKAHRFEDTDWGQIALWYDHLYRLNPSPFILLNKAIVKYQQGQIDESQSLLNSLDSSKLEQRVYLYHSTWAEIHEYLGNHSEAKLSYELALDTVSNQRERLHLKKRLNTLENLIQRSS